VDIAGKLDVFTVAAWVNADAIRGPHQSLLASDGWSEMGRFHWNVLPDSRLQLGICGETRAYESDLLPKSASLLMKWTHVALVLDHGTQRVAFFVDGRPAGTHRAEQHIPVCIGPACIGVWKPKGKLPSEDPQRSFFGRIDEMVVIGRALSDREISQMYESGKP
jgi:hypothetical protein